MLKLIAREGDRVQFANGDRSEDSWHAKCDAAGIVLLEPENFTESGYVYMSNSEVDNGMGGVYGLYFDKFGNVTNYKPLLVGTSKNCGGGHTPWNTWVSCEESLNNDGQCWQIDSSGKAEATKLGGSEGGKFESVAVNPRNPDLPVFYVTEDRSGGALRRFIANGTGWQALHNEDGMIDFLHIVNETTYEWTSDKSNGIASARQHFPNCEGIQFHEGKLYFMSKTTGKMFILNVDNMTYEVQHIGKKFYGQGSFGVGYSQGDQNFFGPSRKYMYFTEDGSSTDGVHARYTDGTYMTLFRAIKGGIHSWEETVGIALSPNNMNLYAGYQSRGHIFEFSRKDGKPFE